MFLFLAINTSFLYLCCGLRIREGNEERSLLLFSDMNMEKHIDLITRLINEMVLEEPGYFLVDVKEKSGNKFQVYVDADQGASLGTILSFHRRLYKKIEEEGIFAEGDFALEVSSPDLDEPLKLLRQYIKNIGRMVEVLQKDGEKLAGTLLSTTATGIVVEETKGKNKKKEVLQHTISFENIKTTIIQVVF